MTSPIRSAGLLAAALLVVACQTTPGATTGATAAGTPSVPATAGPATAVPASAAPASVVPSAAAGLDPASLNGDWEVVASNARVISATGDHVGGSVSIEGNRFVFTAGDYRQEGPVEFTGTLGLECDATRCKIAQVPLLQIRVVDGVLRVVNAATLVPLGAFLGQCGWADVPDGGVVQVVTTGDVAGQTLPTVVKITTGAGGGVGTDCSTGGHVVAWDLVATRKA
ncbi:MAG TPA: hypothetical protein VM451_05155 [Candidatus Limnocylindria bacterium]|nr:hypothetical protein [Candidatus Limnocylindria bacterium]